MRDVYIKEYLEANSRQKYRQFTGSLNPGSRYPVMGVRVPLLRELAKKLAKEYGINAVDMLSDDSQEEVLLQGFVIAYSKMPLAEKKPYIDNYIAKCDNWSLIDSFVSTFHFNRKDEALMWRYLGEYRKSKQTFTVRFVLVMMLNRYLKDEYINDILEYCSNIDSEEYYIEMAQGWLLATAAINYFYDVELILKDGKLNMFTHNRTIQKAVESFRISAENKERLRALRR
ncbi:MAG: DNA alkylation repair protein [Erysipelotrichaceae bacterium]|nr:DNA alkylation repair protein [Erysipelotrichaceae bacterium]